MAGALTNSMRHLLYILPQINFKCECPLCNRFNAIGQSVMPALIDPQYLFSYSHNVFLSIGRSEVSVISLLFRRDK